MTLERESADSKGEKKKHLRACRGRMRKENAIKRSHIREKKMLEHREALGSGLTPAESERLTVLHEIYG